MAYTPQTFNRGMSSGGVQVQNASELATALQNIDTAVKAAGDVTSAAAATAAALTDSSGGTASQTLAATAGVSQIVIPITNAKIADGDLVTTYTPGYKFKILAFDYITGDPVTTAAKASTINLEIGTTNVTGGVISLASASMTPIGAEVAGTAITAANTGSASDTISIEASSTTTFVEGDGMFVITIQNMDVADAIASIADDYNKLLTDVGLIRTAVNALITALA